MFGFDFAKGRRGQGAFEYILMLAGLMLVVLLILVVLSGTSGTSSTQANLNVCYNQVLNSFDCKYSTNLSYAYGNNLTNRPSACTSANASMVWNCSSVPAALQKNTT